MSRTIWSNNKKGMRSTNHGMRKKKKKTWKILDLITKESGRAVIFQAESFKKFKTMNLFLEAYRSFRSSFHWLILHFVFSTILLDGRQTSLNSFIIVSVTSNPPVLEQGTNNIRQPVILPCLENQDSSSSFFPS
jgi:hypothetical protein